MLATPFKPDHAGLLVRSFDRLVERGRDRILIFSDNMKVSAGDLCDWSDCGVAEIHASPLVPGSVVGLVAPSGPAFLAGFLAIRRASCTALLLDHSSPEVDRHRVISAIGPQAVLVCENKPKDRRIDFRLVRSERPRNGDYRLDRAVIKMTSGSTGKPCGIAVSDEALLSDEDCLARTMGFNHDDRLVASLSMSHSYGFTTLALSALMRGLPLIMSSSVDPFAPILAAQRFQGTVFPTVPAYLKGVLRLSHAPAWPESIRLFVAAGSRLSAATAEQFRRASGRPVHVFYGASECGGICFDREGDAAERGTVGTPVDGVSISLDTVGCVPETGRVVVRSESVGETYFPSGNSRLANGCFLTEDLACWRKKELVLIDRTDRNFKIKGHNVNPAEIEEVLSSFPGADEVFVHSVNVGEESELVLRAVMAFGERSADPNSILAWCRSQLSSYKVPRSLVLVEEIPRNSRGKIDREALERLRSDFLNPDLE